MVRVRRGRAQALRQIARRLQTYAPLPARPAFPGSGQARADDQAAVRGAPGEDQPDDAGRGRGGGRDRGERTRAGDELRREQREAERVGAHRGEPGDGTGGGGAARGGGQPAGQPARARDAEQRRPDRHPDRNDEQADGRAYRAGQVLPLPGRNVVDAEAAGEGRLEPERPDQRAGHQQDDRYAARETGGDLGREAAGDQGGVAELADRRRRGLG